ncbi:MAG: hypothetical protein M5R40_20600 [Anaerolineae bacterium]|nr:hypothetical protein [Anaerolineae bacterium]
MTGLPHPTWARARRASTASYGRSPPNLPAESLCSCSWGWGSGWDGKTFWTHIQGDPNLFSGSSTTTA